MKIFSRSPTFQFTLQVTRLSITCISYIECVNKSTLKISLRVILISKEIWTSVFVGLVLSESLNVVLFYIFNIKNICNPRHARKHYIIKAGLSMKACYRA